MIDVLESVEQVVDGLDENFVDLIFRGAYYIDQGTPLKDAMDDGDIQEAIMTLAYILTCHGWVDTYTEDDEEE